MKIKTTQKITPFLWFADQAEPAAKFYVALFKNSKIKRIHRYDESGAGATGRPKGSVMTVAFQLAGQEFTALNGGPVFKFTEAISLVVHCADQKEVDFYWKKLTAGGEPGQCGWLKDKYGLSWQIVPDALLELLGDKDPAKAGRVMQAMLGMQKIVIKDLQRAHAGR